MREIAETKRRYGCPRIYVRLRREGWRVNHKKVERLYSGGRALVSRRRRRKKAVAVPRVAMPIPPDQDSVMRWTLSMTGWPLVGGLSV